MGSNVDKGRIAEEQALRYLLQKNYLFKAKNFRHSHGEIDLIMLYNDVLVFAEVKSLKNERFGYPEDAVDYKKQNLLQSTAEFYILQNNWEGEIRFDIVSILYRADNQMEIEHFEDAF